jgi:ATP-dependent helicase/nuclease subunit B
MATRLTAEEYAKLEAQYRSEIIGPGAGEDAGGAGEDAGAADDDAETALGNYRCGRMTRTIAAAARILTQQIRDGSVDDIYFESAFGKGSDFPAITAIQTTGGDSGEEIRIEGRIDRVDILEGGFARITDYKSGAQEFSVPDAAAGYQLQLMIYLQAVSERFQPAGVFYFRIKEPRVEDDGSSNVAEKIMKSMKPDGVAVNDARILTAMGIDPDGRSKKNRMAPGEWDALRDTVGVLLKELIGNLSSGRVEAAPKTAVKLKTLASRNQKACDYCPYKGICNYDPAF